MEASLKREKEVRRQVKQPRDLRRGVSYCAAFAGLVLCWALENYCVQASIFSTPPTTTHPLSYEALRLAFNAFWAAMAILLLSRYWLIACMVFDTFASVAIVAYARYFHRGLSIYYDMASFKEGLKAAAGGARVIPLAGWILLFLALGLKIFWAWRITPPRKNYRFALAGLCAVSISLGIVALQFTSFRFSHISVMRGSRAIFAYGNLTSWVAEFFYSPDLVVVEKELRDLQNVSPDRLSGSEPIWPVSGNVIIIQLEGVGWDILDYKIGGVPVTPYLTSLARSSRTFKVRSFHDLGSADMDYAVLSGGTPSSRMVSYTIPGIVYTNALPQFMRNHGFHTASFHGNHGGFFNRLPNYEQMGFDEIWFKKDIEANARERSTDWGARDHDVLNCSSERLCASSQRQFHLIITLDSHMPFNLIEDQEKHFYPHSSVWQENYFNSMAVLDHDICAYVESLPPGTLVVLYGDHTPGVVYKDFSSTRQKGNVEYVPCIVHLCKPATPWPAEPGLVDGLPEDLRILDIMNCLRRQIAAQTCAAKPDSQKKPDPVQSL